jgi:hypothetical protein
MRPPKSTPHEGWALAEALAGTKRISLMAMMEK